VIRHQKLSAVANADSALNVDSTFQECVVFLEKLLDIKDHTVPKQATTSGVEYPRRDLMKNELIVTNMDSVACVCATLVASYDVDLLSEHVYDLSLSFITPLASNDDCAGTLIRHDVPCKTTKKKRVRPRAEGRTRD
tara:strand:- start:132 stop:542 length:411 start_codon:yes stop_codon:yes gene_type:complete